MVIHKPSLCEVMLYFSWLLTYKCVFCFVFYWKTSINYIVLLYTSIACDGAKALIKVRYKNTQGKRVTVLPEKWLLSLARLKTTGQNHQTPRMSQQTEISHV